jgi:hypothetical protein
MSHSIDQPATQRPAPASTLEDLLASGTILEARDVLTILGDLAVTLDGLHARGLQYGVLTPSAVLFHPGGRPYLLSTEDVAAEATKGGYLAPSNGTGF